jgi:hypothetical protein
MHQAVLTATRDQTSGGFDEMLSSMGERVGILNLNLDGLRVVTEAATGVYSCTAVIAAMAGATHVTALTRNTTRYGSARDAAEATLGLARAAGVADRIEVVQRLDSTVLDQCDVLTNSGHLRPITATMIDRLPRRAVIALMFEAWEFRGTDLDLGACRRRGIRVAAVNERHPDVAVFPFLGSLCVLLLGNAGMVADGCRIALLCDNPFADFVRAGLAAAGAAVGTYTAVGEIPSDRWDAIVVSLDPGRNAALSQEDFRHLSRIAPNALIAQFFGDIDRSAADAAGFRVVPDNAPLSGHMGILLNALGAEPIIRLQSGGLKAAEIIYRGGAARPDGVAHEV